MLKNGKSLEEGKTVYNLDSCTNCTCSNGMLRCEVQECPKVKCHSYYETRAEVDGFCCPLCIQIKPVVEPMQPHLQSQPETECENVVCPRGCAVGELMQPVSGQCCSFVCVKADPSATPPPDPVGETGNQCEGEGPFVDPDAPCQNCSCSNGYRSCFLPACPELSCESTVQLPDQCCPTCAEPPAQCIEGSEKVEDCMRCLCFVGEYHCFYEEELCQAPTQPPCLEYSAKSKDCMKCICLGGEYRCFPDVARCGPEKEEVKTAAGAAMTYTHGENGCFVGETRRMPGCMRCRCNDGVAFSCFFDETLCRPGRRPSSARIEGKASKSRAMTGGKRIAKLVKQALGKAWVQNHFVKPVL